MSILRVNLSTLDNPFKFINPIRRFKDNDPYVSIVDNIPIKQLEENILWLKQAVESATIDIQNQPTEFGREQFSELKPYVEVNTLNNIVYVKPGRFNARINDAYNLTPLQTLTRLTFNDIRQLDSWDVKTVDDANLLLILNRIKSLNASDALGMNGLTERNFVSPYTLTTTSIFDAPVPNVIPGTVDVGFNPVSFNLTLLERYPAFFTFLWGNGTTPTAATQNPISRTSTVTKNLRELFFNESDFVKRWRGVARTAVVDVPTTLSATIENFTTDDFNYYAANGQLNTSLASEVNSRIDLLFIYSKPIDQTETYVSEYTDGAVASGYGNSPSEYSPRKLFKAELGIIKGAGIQMGYNSNSKWFFANAQTALNRPEILGSVTDQLNDNLGFTELGVNGSFPSPDDLMNTAPLLAEWLPKRHFSLVGQSVLPVAYIVVRKNSLNSQGNQALISSDVIDIRPFFRTTELAYNERAGLAAAIPQVSIMNPVATETYVDTQIQKLLQVINNLSVTSTGTSTGTGGGTTGTNTTLSLLKDQYNEIYVDAPTNRLLSRNPVYFGGQYFGIWPATPVQTTIPSNVGPVSVTGLTESFVQQTLTEWSQGRDSILDGIYKLDKGDLGSLSNRPIWEQREATQDQVRWYIFTLQRLPLKLGTINTETWDILIEPVKALSLNTFIQSPRDLSGYPLFNTDQLTSTTAATRTTGAALLATRIFDVDSAREEPAKNIEFPLKYPIFSRSYDHINNQFLYLTLKITEETPLHWIRLIGSNTATNRGALVPGWLIQQDFDGSKLYNNDFKCFAVKFKVNNAPPREVATTAQGFATNPYDIKVNRLYKSPLSSYGNSSVDIRVALMVSNRVMVKDVGFKITNMRVS